MANYCTDTVVLAWRVPPPSVTQWRRNVAAEVRTGVATAPFTLVLPAFCDVNPERSGLDITHDCIPEVTHPSADVLPDATAFGFATRTIEGLPICTLHCALPVRPWSVHVRP